MNEETFNMSMRKFLKKVGVTSQREIEKAVTDAIESGKIKGNERLPVSIVLNVPEVNLNFKVEDTITLE